MAARDSAAQGVEVLTPLCRRIKGESRELLVTVTVELVNQHNAYSEYFYSGNDRATQCLNIRISNNLDTIFGWTEILNISKTVH